MDFLIGAYRSPPQEPGAFGLSQAIPKSYLRQLLHPFSGGRRRTDLYGEAVR
jgi:hypothetical protein